MTLPKTAYNGAIEEEHIIVTIPQTIYPSETAEDTLVLASAAYTKEIFWDDATTILWDDGSTILWDYNASTFAELSVKGTLPRTIYTGEI